MYNLRIQNQLLAFSTATATAYIYPFSFLTQTQILCLSQTSLLVLVVFVSLSSMAASDTDREAIKAHLLDTIKSMEDEGMVDSNFGKVHRLKEIAGPFFFASVVPKFCHDSTTTFRSLTVALSRPDPNYYEIGELCFKIKGSASSIGACRMAFACRELLRAVQNKEAKESCVTKLNGAKQEFFTLQDKMDSLVQLERRIVCTETDGA